MLMCTLRIRKSPAAMVELKFPASCTLVYEECFPDRERVCPIFDNCGLVGHISRPSVPAPAFERATTIVHCTHDFRAQPPPRRYSPASDPNTTHHTITALPLAPASVTATGKLASAANRHEAAAQQLRNIPPTWNYIRMYVC